MSASFMHPKLEDHMLPCFSKTMFGITCLGCGLQRSFIFLTKGEFIDAFKMYPAIYTLILFFLVILLSFFVKFKNSKKIIGRLAYLNLSLMIINYIVKLTL